MNRKFLRAITFSALASLTGAIGFAQTATVQDAPPSAGAVFIMTNNLLQNTVLMYRRSASGSLALAGSFATGGRGSGGTNDPLESQNALVITKDHLLVAANPGSGDISVFSVSNSGLKLLSVTSAGGSGPISIAVHDALIYVLNYVGNYHTAGFTLQADGTLQPIPNSRQTLSGLDVGACTIGFTPDGSKLVVTERISNKIDVFTVNADGSLGGPVYNTSVGVGPFGFRFTSTGILIVTETNGGPPNDGTTSSYLVNSDNTVTAVTPKADASGQAPCWISLTDTYAWVSDSVTGNIGAYNISANGSLTSIGTVAAPSASAFPIDSALSAGGKFFYVLYSGLGQIGVYSVGAGGTLTALTSATAGRANTGTVGLAAY